MANDIAVERREKKKKIKTEEGKMKTKMKTNGRERPKGGREAD